MLPAVRGPHLPHGYRSPAPRAHAGVPRRDSLGRSVILKLEPIPPCSMVCIYCDGKRVGGAGTRIPDPFSEEGICFHFVTYECFRTPTAPGPPLLGAAARPHRDTGISICGGSAQPGPLNNQMRLGTNDLLRLLFYNQPHGTDLRVM